MNMPAHESIRNYIDVEPSAVGFQKLEILVIVDVVLEYRMLVVSPSIDVVIQPFTYKTGSSCHYTILTCILSFTLHHGRKTSTHLWKYV